MSMNIRDIITLMEDASEEGVMTLAKDGSNEEEFIAYLMQADGKLRFHGVIRNGEVVGWEITAPDDTKREIQAFIPDGTNVGHALIDYDDVGEWLHQCYLNVSGW